MKRVAFLLPLIVLWLVPTSVRAGMESQVAGNVAPQPGLDSVVAAGFRGGQTIHFPDGMSITLLSYQPVFGLRAFPGGPPLLPRAGYMFVTTIWSAHNTTNHTVFIEPWKAMSRGMWSDAFVVGNAGEAGLVLPGTTEQYSWLFQVAKAGSVAIFYGSFPAHWLPRGRPMGKPPSLPSVASSFGTAPQTCPIASSRMIHPVQAATFYIWAGSGALRGNSDWYIANRRLALGFGARTRYGYPQKVFWQLMNGSHGPVTLRGWNVHTGQRIWFGHPIPPDRDYHLIAWPAAIVRYSRAPTLTFVPSAGCYVLKAQWKGGSWTIPFTAGE